MFFASSNILVAVAAAFVGQAPDGGGDDLGRGFAGHDLLCTIVDISRCGSGDRRALSATAISDAYLQGKRQSRTAMLSQPRCTIIVRDV
jgi:hypothetical protein